MSHPVIRRWYAGLLLVAGCAGEPVDPTAEVPVASVALLPPTPVVGVGASAPLTAIAQSADGTPLPNRTISFVSSDPAVATVDGAGVVTAVAPGTTDITASSETRSSTVPLTVSPVLVASVAVTPATAEVAVGVERGLTGAAFDAGGAALPNRVFAWSSSNPAVASVSSLGVVRGITGGTATITGTSEGQSATAELTVFIPPVASVEVSPGTATVGIGDSLQLTAALKDADGNPITGRPVTWQSSNPLVASVGSADGLVRGLAPGDVTITASAEGKSGAATLGVSLRFSSVSAGFDFTCGVTPVGTVYCWGRNAGGSLGDGSAQNRSVPVAVTLPAGVRFDSVSAGQDHACALARDGSLFCWGSNAFGQLGTGDAVPRSTPAAVISPLGAPGVRYTNVAAGAQFTCARATTDLVYCWGLNFDGQLGNGLNAGFNTPNPRPLEVQGGPFSAVSAFRGHACALTDVGFAVCWGDNASGQLGRGGPTSPGDPIPAQISGSRRFSGIAAGDGHACAVGLLDGSTWCWGSNAYGQLGASLGGAALSTFPVQVSGSRVFDGIAAGRALSCAVARSGGAGFCWGSNEFGQLGIGSTTMQPSPPQPRVLTGGLRFGGIDAGAAHACGVTIENVAYCWGRPNDGLNLDANALGTGSPVTTRSPAPVSGQ